MVSPARSPGRRRVRIAAVLVGAVGIATEVIPLWRHGYHLGGTVTARCSRQHLFRTLWLPGASLKALRLGGRRFQRCPVDAHWGLVRLVREADLSEAERRLAREHRDLPLP